MSKTNLHHSWNRLLTKAFQNYTLSIALETNGRGFHGFIIELPGAFVRGRTEQETLSKTQKEATSYSKWLESPAPTQIVARIVQRHQCELAVEDGDCEILLHADQDPLDQMEFALLRDLVKHSGQTFSQLYESVSVKNWVDSSKARPTFYGQTPKTIRENFDHVKNTQYYYLSRTKTPFQQVKDGDFLAIRQQCLDQLTELYSKNGNSEVFSIDNENWTLAKILRRFIWHDRIHAKAIVRILQKQQSRGLIQEYTDPFCFQL
jgi:hypothetical protein